ncbi:hypothetical protein [Archangium sp.]|uniref:hypothetical protein n=1 Tax=Archangium sp. TaxID=1872627 RepID=UPI002EDA2371
MLIPPRLPLTLLIAMLPTLVLAREWDGTPRHVPSLLVGPVATYTELVGPERARRGIAGHLELGGSVPVGYEENELFFLARAGGGTPGLSLTVHGGFRSVFGEDEWQTYADLGAAVHLRPELWAGPRVGVGVRRALNETFTFYGGLGGGLGFGSGLRLDVELSTGLRWSL